MSTEEARITFYAAPEKLRHQTNEEALVANFTGQFDNVTIRAVYEQVRARFDGAPVRDFVPLLTSRYAAEELKRLENGAENGI